ncbi:MAG TPA: choice-of-anchor tandem repeat GloVer-containing protein [Verrucomicrobiae bacterium]|nr:choice-of-anchor tandem repeat GloVer-containing protein [Verrucomicrobiae bacterium]
MRKRQVWVSWVAVIVSLATIAMTAQAQSIGILHSFASSLADGANPEGQPILIGSTLYGLAFDGGSNSDGAVYQISTNGTGFSVVYSFTGGTNGTNPFGTLATDGTSFYGMTFNGGVDDGGVAFAVSTNGTYRLLHTFLGGGGDGQYPYGSLVVTGTTLYGMTNGGGTNEVGVIFSLGTGGSPFSVLHSFAGGTSDGALPNEGVILNGTTLYGTTSAGGSNNEGIVFAYNTALTSNAFTILHHFVGGNNDGAGPFGPLTLSGSTLYGLTSGGGTNNLGIVFQIGMSGSGFKVLHSFAGGASDGAYPQFGPLTVVSNTIYGATEGGGTNGEGVLFEINTDGTGFAMVHSFAGGTNDGAFPEFGPLVAGSTFYGVTTDGGTNNLGVVYGPVSAGMCGFVSATTPTNLFMMVTAGQVYTYTASGTACYDVDLPSSDCVGPNGGFAFSTNGQIFVCMGLAPESLVGELNGTCIQLGTSGTFVAPSSGTLNLLMNDTVGTFFNNSGGWNVCITPVPCPGTNFLTQVSGIQLVNSNIIITLPTVPCEQYQLQYTPAMVPTNWANLGAAVTGTGNPIQFVDYGVVTPPVNVTWLDLPWPIDQNWGGSQGSPATTNGNVITLTGQDVLSEQSFSGAATISFNVTLTSETTGNGAFEFFFVPSGEASNSLPNPDVVLQISFSPNGVEVATNHYAGIVYSSSFTVNPPVIFTNSITVAANGALGWTVNGQTFPLGSLAVMPYSSYQIRLSSWQPTQIWQVSNFSINGVLQRFYRVDEYP